ncbi:MliC family protein [Solimonas sp. SE-A11]|uniref:MliC family protein n=1 Tax=Solimonas sp. SE-A11 TaxID=3054954 RepID=UPI00259D2331|nr:MliC family protein [Solimonas sp. SE-A11]MDM4769986.1 MliC family protein [Solimonas sp. SE-A11]
MPALRLLLIAVLLAGCSRGTEAPPAAAPAADAPAPIPENVVIEEPATAQPMTMLYRCEGDAKVTVAMLDAESEKVAVTLPGEDAVELSQAPSASGARYVGDKLVFLGKGDEATFERDGKTVFSGCKLQAAAG